MTIFGALISLEITGKSVRKFGFVCNDWNLGLRFFYGTLKELTYIRFPKRELGDFTHLHNGAPTHDTTESWQNIRKIENIWKCRIYTTSKKNHITVQNLITDEDISVSKRMIAILGICSNIFQLIYFRYVFI